MTYETKITKGYHGLTAKSEFSLGIVQASGFDKEGERFIQIRTSKGLRGGINSSASVIVRRRDECGTSEQTAIFQDYTKQLASVPCARVTEKALVQTHNLALEQFPAIIAEASSFYNLPAPISSRPGDEPAIMAAETGIDYARCLVMCNMD